jgi:hypothetical protein
MSRKGISIEMLIKALLMIFVFVIIINLLMFAYGQGKEGAVSILDFAKGFLGMDTSRAVKSVTLERIEGSNAIIKVILPRGYKGVIYFGNIAYSNTDTSKEGVEYFEIPLQGSGAFRSIPVQIWASKSEQDALNRRTLVYDKEFGIIDVNRVSQFTLFT